MDYIKTCIRCFVLAKINYIDTTYPLITEDSFNK